MNLGFKKDGLVVGIDVGAEDYTAVCVRKNGQILWTVDYSRYGISQPMVHGYYGA